MAIIPSIGGGFRDYLPKDMISRQRMIDTVRDCFEMFGFVPLDTPGIEKEEILTGGDENFSMQIFRVRTRSAAEKLALRFDLTVPLARIIASYPEETRRPFKRYQVGKVYRAEKPQAGRFREFMQFDADIVGSSNTMADAEIVSLIYETMQALGFEKFLIRVNSRKILNGLASYAGFPEEKTPVILRIIDKLDKQGWSSVRDELFTLDVDGSNGGLPALSRDSVEAIQHFLDIRSGTQDETLVRVRQLMSESDVARDGISDLACLADNVRALGVPDSAWTIDLSVARGLGYYTGIVFETMLTDLPEIGSVFSGGRYDDLVSRFGSVSVPATGASIGVDRLFAAMEALQLIQQRGTVAQVMILNFDPGCKSYVQRVASLLRKGGISTEVYLGNEVTLKAQLAFAVRQEYPYVIIAGENEMNRKVVQLKNMGQRKQYEVSFGSVLATIVNML